MQDKGLYNAGSLGIESALSTNKVLKNTYMLLGMTLLFSAATAGISMAMNLPHGAQCRGSMVDELDYLQTRVLNLFCSRLNI